MDKQPYRWQILLSFIFFLTVTLIFFAIATKPEAKIKITSPNITTITEPTVSFIDPQIGATVPTVTIVEFAEYTCASCADLNPILAKLVSKYPNDVKLVWKDFPNETKSDQATPSAIAARCADEQGAFWPFHDTLMLRSSQLSTDVYTAIAQGLNLKADTFNSCFTTNEPLPRVRKSYEEGLALSITATPTLFINGVRYTGGVTFDELDTLVKVAKAKIK